MKMTIEARVFDTERHIEYHELSNDFLTENDAILLADVALTLVDEYEGKHGIEQSLFDPKVSFYDDNDSLLPFNYNKLLEHVTKHDVDFSRDSFGNIVIRVHGEIFSPDRHHVDLPM